MFKVEKCILNYVRLKHPWVLEVIPLSVNINEKIVLWLWSPSSLIFLDHLTVLIYFRAAIFKSIFFFQNASSECFPGLLEHWVPLKMLKISYWKNFNPTKFVPSPPFPTPLQNKLISEYFFGNCTYTCLNIFQKIYENISKSLKVEPKEAGF